MWHPVTHRLRRCTCAVAALIVSTVLPGCVSTPATPATPPPPIRSSFLALRLAFADSAPGRQAARYADTTVFLAPEVLMSDDDVIRVRPSTGADGELVLQVHYQPAVSQQLLAATGAHVGDRLAVLLDSRIWSLARIQSAIGRGESLAIATDATGLDAERLAAHIRTKWPPR